MCLGSVSNHAPNNKTTRITNPAAVKYLETLIRPANAKTAEIAKGSIISNAIAKASDTRKWNGIFGLMLVTLNNIRTPTMIVASI